LEEITGAHYDRLHIIGGGTQNRLLNQFSADATQRTCLTGPVEATALGNVLMQAVALGTSSRWNMPASWSAHPSRLRYTNPDKRRPGMKAYERLLAVIKQMENETHLGLSSWS